MASFRLCYFPGGVKDVRIGHRGTSGVRRDLTPKIWRESASPECLISESSSLKGGIIFIEREAFGALTSQHPVVPTAATR